MTKALIIGGGIGGLIGAIALRRAGIDATVYERGRELQEVGAGIALASNAMKALSLLGLADRIAEIGLPLASATIKTCKGQVIVRAGDQTGNVVNSCVHRVDLQQTLVECLGEEHLRLGCEFTGIECSGNTVRACFANGEVETGDLLIGADGVRSVVRASIHGTGMLRYAGYTAWRAVTPFTMPPTSSESWGCGRRFGIVPIGNDRIYWFATMNAPEGESDPPQGRKEQLLQVFRGWHQPIEAILVSTGSSATCATTFTTVSR